MKPPEQGELLADRFVVSGQLGEGGSSVVFRAHDIRLDRDVAFKLLTPRYLGRPEREQRLLDEGTYLRKIGSHPNIVALVDAGRLSTRNDWPYVVTELLEGTSLDRTLIYTKPPLHVLRELAHQLALALAACHATGVVHRDVTPSNVFVVEDGQGHRSIKLFDFSHAGVVDGPRVAAGEPGRLTGIWDVPGTHGYMGPEQVETAPADPKMDVFAFGIVLYEIITNHNPYEHIRDREKFIDMQRRGVLEAPRLHAWAFEVPEALAKLVTACTDRDPDQRPDMREVASRLASLELPAEDDDVTLAIEPRLLADGRKRQHDREIGSWTPTAALSAPAPANDDVTEERTAIVSVIRPQVALTEPGPSFARARSVAELPPIAPAPPPRAEDSAETSDETPQPATAPSRRRVIAISAMAVAALMLAVAFGVYLAPWLGAGDPNQNEDETAPERDRKDGPGAHQPIDHPIPAAIRDPELPQPEPPSPEVAPQPPQADPGPRYATEACATTRKDARQAERAGRWSAVEKLARDRECWSSSTQPLRLQVRALFELGRFEECVRVGSKSKDVEVKKWTTACEGIQQ